MKNISALLCCFLFGLFVNSTYSQKKDQRPNIVYIMSDDHACQAISAYGYGLNQTPNIDKLAREGAIFTNACVTNSLCAPSRAVLLTGKHSFINGKVDNEHPFDWNQENFCKLLQRSGYQTAMIGKIHMDGLPQGFDHSAVLIDQGEYYNPNFIINGVKQQKMGYVTDLTTDMTLDWIKQRDTTKPFCVLYHQKAPHREWMPALKYIKEYSGKTFKEPASLFDDYSGRGTAARTAEMTIAKDMNWTGDNKVSPDVAAELGLKDALDWGTGAYRNNLGRMTAEERSAWNAVYDPIIAQFKQDYPSMSKQQLVQWRYQRYMQDYMGCIASVDDGVGKLLGFLKDNGLDSNTIVIYTSDNGFYLGEHGWFDKRFMYEESLRVPLLIRYPGYIKPGTSIDALVQNLDFAPTLLDFAGVKIPAAMQGESFKALVSRKEKKWRDAIYYTYYEYPSIHMVKRHYGIKTKRYKLIHFYYDINEWELYDLKTDPGEMKNVYNDPVYAKVKGELHAKLDALREKYRDSDENDRKFLPKSK